MLRRQLLRLWLGLVRRWSLDLLSAAPEPTSTAASLAASEPTWPSAAPSIAAASALSAAAAEQGAPLRWPRHRNLLLPRGRRSLHVLACQAE